MNRRVQYRLVGTSILVALAVIFLPDLLDGRRQHELVSPDAIPLRPTLMPQQKIPDEMAQDAQLVAQVDELDALADDVTAQQGVIAQADSDELPAEVQEAQVGNTNTAATNTAAVATVDTDDIVRPAQPVSLKPILGATPAPKTPATAAPTAAVSAKPTAAVVATATPRPSITPKPTPKVQPTPAINAKQTADALFSQGAWSIQLGAFRDAANVNQLVKKLRDAGYPVYTVPSPAVQGQLNRVFVGPEVSKDKQQQRIGALKALINIEGSLVRYDPMAY